MSLATCIECEKFIDTDDDPDCYDDYGDDAPICESCREELLDE